jgi:hypothetical protein
MSFLDDLRPLVKHLACREPPAPLAGHGYGFRTEDLRFQDLAYRGARQRSKDPTR